MSCDCKAALEAAEKTTDCQCPAAGYCQRHRCEKNEHFHTLCKQRLDYFVLWEEGRGPCIGKSPVYIGLGDVVEAAIRALTFGLIKSSAACGCEGRKVWLNRVPVWGWWR